MSQLQIEIDTQNELKRTLNWFQLTAIGLGAIIGE
jgi:amino acid transporter